MDASTEKQPDQKPVIVIDAGPLIKNEPPVSTLLQSHQVITTPEVLSEIRDAAARSRVETTLKPFLVLRRPRADSVKVIADFARRTGDLAVLSRQDVQLLALAYEMECERNGGDWRLRSMPGQKRLNGKPPGEAGEDGKGGGGVDAGVDAGDEDGQPDPRIDANDVEETVEESASDFHDNGVPTGDSDLPPDSVADELHKALEHSHISEPATDGPTSQAESKDPELPAEAEDGAGISSDSEAEDGWITATNLKSHQAKDSTTAVEVRPEKEAVKMQVATLTTDFAMQNVLLLMNLNLLSPSLHRVRHLKTYILRCHACFEKVKDMSKRFCPRCGKPTLTRVACSTNDKGEFQVHLKKNMQWNTRGDRYSIPKPVQGSSNGRLNIGGGGKGGGKGGWGNGLILAEDQKEYQRVVARERRRKERDIMDEDYLPGILSGERLGSGGKVRIGAGRTVNSRKR